MKKQQYIVFGLNRFGTSVARTLAAAGNEVVAVDQDADRVAQIADDVSYAVQVDVADEDAMSGLGMEHMDGAVIAVASNMEASIVIAMKCKEYNNWKKRSAWKGLEKAWCHKSRISRSGDGCASWKISYGT